MLKNSKNPIYFLGDRKIGRLRTNFSGGYETTDTLLTAPKQSNIRPRNNQQFPATNKHCSETPWAERS